MDGALGVGAFKKVPSKIDQAAVYAPREQEGDIPPFVEISFNQESHFLLMTVPGRRTECRHCD